MRSRLQRFAVSLTVAVLVAVAVHREPAAAGGEAENVIEVIVSSLPPSASPELARLKSAANVHSAMRLEMTKSEVWSLPADRIEALEAEARKTGTAVMRLDATWNQALMPMAAGTPMAPGQSLIVKQVMDGPGVMGMAAMSLPDPRKIENAFMGGMPGKPGPASTIVLPLKAGLTVNAVRTGLEKTADGYVWRGHIEGRTEPVTLMWWPSGRLSGHLAFDGHVYSIRHLGGDMHAVLDTSAAAEPPEHAPADPALMKKMNMGVDPIMKQGDPSSLRPARGKIRDLEDAPAGSERQMFVPPGPVTAPPGIADAEPVEIDVIVAFTPAAAARYTDIRRDLIELAIADANASFASSGIGHVRLNLVHVYETTYREAGSHFDHVFLFADRGDGVMEEVHELRDRFKADIAVLVVHDPMGCGLAAGVAPGAERAFAVVHEGCAATSYSIAHEVGHILGARHDLSQDDSTAPFPFGHGFVAGTAWRTMMSYKDSCGGCPRLPIWSNPAISIGGIAAGSEIEHNARVIGMRAKAVSLFR